MSLMNFYSSFEPKLDIAGAEAYVDENRHERELAETEAAEEAAIAVKVAADFAPLRPVYESSPPATEDIVFGPVTYEMLYNHDSSMAFTVENPLGLQYTFKVTKADHRDAYFVALYTPEKRRKKHRYLFMVVEDRSIIFTKKSTVTLDDLETKIYMWAVKLLKAEKPLPTGYRIFSS